VGNLTTQLSDDSRTIYKATGEAAAKQLQAICTLIFGLIIGIYISLVVVLSDIYEIQVFLPVTKSLL
jgi:hypothetical protein